MKKPLSTATKALMLALAASTFSFAGPGLADGAAKFVGNIIQGSAARSDYTTLWNQATAENGCKWGSVEGTRGQYNWRDCDAAYNWAKQNGGHFKFHALVWGSQYPNWLPNLSVDETKKAITAWFDAVQQRYPDLEMIDVVNEAIRGNGGGYHSGYNNTKIIQALGGDNNGDYAFITTAFKMARDRWPNAILIYNDYNTIQWDVNGGINLVNTIKKNGAPIDGYGLQAHDLMTNGGGNGGTGGGGDCMKYNDFKSTMEKIHRETNNIPIFISEYDVPSTDDGIQKQCVSEQFSYWMEDPHVAGITFWGYVYGQTWLDCHNKTVKGCSGLIKDGKDRSAMTWLKDYLSKNKGVNETGLPTGDGASVDPEPQLPFKGEAFAVPGKIEAEYFDVPGKGKNEDGTYNTSFSESTSENHGLDAGKAKSKEDSTKALLRKDDAPGVDLYANGTGTVIGYNETGEWYEYTINVSEAGDYTLFAAVSGEGGKMVFLLDEKPLSDTIAVSKANAIPSEEESDDIYNDYYKVKTNVTLPAGKHILRMAVAQQYFDVDYFTLVKGKDATDPEPIVSDPEEPQFVQPNLQLDNSLQHYFVIDPMGVRMGVISGYGFEAAGEMLRESPRVTSSGVYYLKNRKTGQMQAIRIVK